MLLRRGGELVNPGEKFFEICTALQPILVKINQAYFRGLNFRTFHDNKQDIDELISSAGVVYALAIHCNPLSAKILDSLRPLIFLMKLSNSGKDFAEESQSLDEIENELFLGAMRQAFPEGNFGKSMVFESQAEAAALLEAKNNPVYIDNNLFTFLENRILTSIAFHSGILSSEVIIKRYSRIISELVAVLSDSSGLEIFKEKLQNLYDASFMIRAVISDCDENTRNNVKHQLKRASVPLIRATRGRYLIANSKKAIARAELRGFLVSLDISPELARRPIGALTEISRHRSGLYYSKVRLDRFVIPSMVLGMSMAYANVPAITFAPIFGMGLAGITAHKLKQTLIALHNRNIPYRPNRDSDNFIKILEEISTDFIGTAGEFPFGQDEQTKFILSLLADMQKPLRGIEKKEVANVLRRGSTKFFFDLEGNNGQNHVFPNLDVIIMGPAQITIGE
jgi:hypothetical protein